MRKRARGSQATGRGEERFILQISDIAPGGDGFGRLDDGRIAFVRGGLPGDTVDIVVDSDKPSHVFASVRALVKPSEQRVLAACPIADRCGGCPLMGLSADGQTGAKESMLRQSLVRIARLSPDELGRVRRLLPAPHALAYRNRLRVQQRGGRLGFFRDKTHDFVAVDECKIAAAPVNELLREAQTRLGDADDSLSAVELRVLPPGSGESEGARAMTLLVRDREAASSVAVRRTMAALEELGVVRVVPLKGPMEPAPASSLQKLWLEPDLYVLLAPGAFNQVNLSVNQALVELVLEAAHSVGAQSFFDLYGGAGNFTMPLLKRGLRGSLVEVQEESVRAARLAAEAQGLMQGEFLTGDVPRVARELEQSGRRADLVVLDPPRKGAFEALESALGLAQKSIVLVSCDPPTLARDLRFLLDRGARLVDVTPLDMFPHTHHLEVVARLDVRGRAADLLKGLE